MVSADRTLVCRDCGSDFIFSAGEQEFYAERGFVQPSRCPTCRANRRGDRPGSGAGVSQQRSRESGFREPRPMFPAICADCGRETMVPFEPRAGRAVYCRDCFARHRDEYR